ncbi:MFS transporter [Phytohabitans kaempferiae]|uniref:MFS transporter n=1 Tax=Phytohabitans kaempferiae TaxID=1620943 RepID=A0ABV6LZ08_9ACTN
MTGAPSSASHVRLLVSVLLYSTTLGVTAVAFPLRTLEAGYGIAAVGYLGAFGAVSQAVSRTALPFVLRRVSDRWLVRTACVLMAASAAVLVVSTTLAAFLVSAALLGVSRSLYWTGSQVYVLRGDLPVGQRRLAHIQFVSNTGEFVGPLGGGLVADQSITRSLLLCVVLMAFGLGAVWILDRHPPLARTGREQITPIWRQRSVALGCAGVVTAGGWRGLVSSVIPAMLAEVGRSPGQIGVLIGLGNAASMGGSLLAGRVGARWYAATTYASIGVTGVAVAFTGLLAGSVVASGLGLAVSGLGAGLLQTLGTVLATSEVHESQRGDVVVLTGLLRSLALFALPAGVAARVGALATATALAVGGGLLMLPLALGMRRRQ